MVAIFVVPLRAAVPNWLALAVVIASIALALLTLSLILIRIRPAYDEESGSARAMVRDPVLLLSATGVIVLAAAAWLLR